jgi:hypothetical protein
MAARVYAGRSTSARRESIIYACPCGERFPAEVWRVVDSTAPLAMAALLDGTLNQVRCPSCRALADVQVAVAVHDHAAPRLALVLPDGLRHREVDELAALYVALAADKEPVTDYVLAAQVVFCAAGLRALSAPPPRLVAVAVPAPAPVEPPPPEPAPPPPAETTNPRAVEPRRARDDEDNHATRVRVTVPDPRSALIERWIAGREGPSAFLVEDSVLVCAALQPQQLETLVPGPLELRVQLHRLPTYPIVTLTLLARADDAALLLVPLDIARAAHRVVLDALAKRTALTVELYDSQYLPVVSHELTAPLEENVRRVLLDGRDALDRLAPPSRSFERARTQLVAPSYDRLGHTPVDLPDEQLHPLETPGAVRAALAAVARWSEPGAEAYLVEIRSLPVAGWRALRARVIRRALDVGIAVPRPLVERSAKEHTSPLPS